MAHFDASRSLLAGLDPTLLQARLTQMQLDYLDISQGRKVESANYSQGDGGKGVSFSKANLGELAQAIRLVQAQLGIERPARARRVYF